MIIENAKYTYSDNKSIKATIDGVQSVVPVNSENRHYAEIMRQVEAGTLTIQEAADAEL